MEKQLLKPLDKEGCVFDYRFDGIAKCNAMVVVPIGSTLIWEILQCVNELGYYNYDLLSIPAFPKRIVEGSNTAISAIDLAVLRHGIEDLVVVQTSDYHHFTGSSSRFTDSFKEDAYHKMALIGAYRELKRLHPKLRIVLVYARVIDANHLVFSVVEETRAEYPIMTLECDVFGKCDGIIVTCMDYKYWREVLSNAWHHLEIRKPTVISMAGSVKNIVLRKKTALKAVSLGVSAYAPVGKKCAAYQHRLCGAYAEELATFESDPVEEEKLQSNELNLSSGIFWNDFGLSQIGSFAKCDNSQMNFIRL